MANGIKYFIDFNFSLQVTAAIKHSPMVIFVIRKGEVPHLKQNGYCVPFLFALPPTLSNFFNF